MENLTMFEAEFAKVMENGEVEHCRHMTVAPTMSQIIIEPTSEDFKMPTYAKYGDSGMDVYSPVDVLIKPGQTVIVALGFKMEIPLHPLHELGYRWEAQARPRSGVSAKSDIRVANAPGTIDNGYRGVVGIILTNHKPALHGMSIEDIVEVINGEVDPSHEAISLGCAYGDYALTLTGDRVLNDIDNGEDGLDVPEGTYIIRKGDKIAQLVFNEVIRPLEITIGTVNPNTDRGEGAYNSTGIK